MNPKVKKKKKKGLPYSSGNNTCSCDTQALACCLLVDTSMDHVAIAIEYLTFDMALRPVQRYTCGLLSPSSSLMPWTFILGLPYLYGNGTGSSTYLVDAQAIACSLVYDIVTKDAVVIDNSTCANFDMANNKRPVQSYTCGLLSLSSSLTPWTYIQGVLSWVSDGNSAGKLEGVEESSTPAPACLSLVNNKWSAILHLLSLPYCCGKGTSTYLVDAQALAYSLLVYTTVDNAIVIEDITCVNFEMALIKRQVQSYTWELLCLSSSLVPPWTSIQVTCRGQNSAEKLEGVEESSVQAPACLSLVNNRWSAILHPVSLPYCCGNGTSTMVDTTQAHAYSLLVNTTVNAIEDITCVNFEMALIKRQVQSYTWGLLCPSSSPIQPWNSIQVTCRGQNSAEKLEGVEVSSAQAPACLSLVNNRWSAILHPVSLPYCCGSGTGTLVDTTQAHAYSLMVNTTVNAIEDITCVNFEMALIKRQVQSYTWGLLCPSSSPMPPSTSTQVTCRGQNSAEKLEGVEESSAQAPACLSLVNNRWSAVLHPVSLPYCCGNGTGTLVDTTQAHAYSLLVNTTVNAIEDITCVNFEMALIKRQVQSYTWGLLCPSSSPMPPWTSIQDVTSRENHGRTVENVVAAIKESSAQAAAHSSLVVATMHTVSESSLDEIKYAASKSSTEPMKRMVSLKSEICELVHSGTTPKSFVHTQEVTHDSEDMMTMPGSPVPELFRKSFTRVTYQGPYLDQNRRLKDFKWYQEYPPGTIIFNSTETVTSILRGKCLGRKKDVFLSKCKGFVMKKRNSTEHLNMWIQLHHHDHVMSLLGVMTAGPDGFYEITEHMNCDLGRAIGRFTLKQLAGMLPDCKWTNTWRNFSHIVKSILKGTAHLNNHDLQHYDIKEHNVFVSKPNGCNCTTILTCTCHAEWIIKVGDFDTLNTIMRPKSWRWGTEFYHPPEIEGGEQYNIRYENPVYDSWSIGIIILHLCDGIDFETSYKNAQKMPWLKNHECHYAKDYLLNLTDTNNRRLFPVIKFAKRCLQDDFKERPTPSELLYMWEYQCEGGISNLF